MASADDIRKINDEISSLARKLGKGPLKVFEPSELNEATAALAGLRAEFSQMDDSATSIYERLRGITSELKGQLDPIQKVRQGFRSVTDIAEQLKNHEQGISRLSTDQVKKLKDKLAIQKSSIASGAQELVNSNRNLTALQEEIKRRREAGATQDEVNNLVGNALKFYRELSEEQKTIIQGHLAEYDAIDDVNGLLERQQAIDRKAGAFTGLANIVKSIPGLSALSGPFEQAAEAARKTGEEFDGNRWRMYTAGVKSLVDSFGPLGFLTATLKFLKDVVFSVSKQTTEIGKSMGLSAANSRLVREQMVSIQNASKDELVTTGKLLDARTQLSKSLGTSVRFTQDQLLAQIKLTERVGIQADEAANIQKLSMLSNQSTEESLDGINSQIAGLAKQTGIQLDNRDILKEVSETNGQIAATLKNNPTLIGKAVIQVRKLGLTLEKARDISKGLLDFESSISNELEAELLTGKDLNLERARSLALQGDFAGAAAEVAKQVGSLAEFQDMNVIAQEALAKAAGMTVDELSNSLAQTENLNRLGKQNREELERQVAELKAQGRVEEANNLMNSLGNEADLKAAQEKIDLQTKFNAAIDKAKSLFSDLFAGSESVGESIVGFLSALMSSLPVIKGALVMLGFLAAAWAVSMAKAAIAAITAMSATTLGIGAVAIALGIGTMVAAYDSAKSTIDDGVIAPDGGLIVSGKKGSIQLNKDDSIVAGTNLGGSGDKGNNDALLKEIRALRMAMEKGGNVYMDGSKVGHVLALAQTSH